MNRYTFITEFRGGTYISQAESKDIESALLLWARNLDTKEIQYWGPSSKAEIIKGVEEKDIYAVPIDDVIDVWFLGGLLKTGSFNANIVAALI